MRGPLGDDFGMGLHLCKICSDCGMREENGPICPFCYDEISRLKALTNPTLHEIDKLCYMQQKADKWNNYVKEET